MKYTKRILSLLLSLTLVLGLLPATSFASDVENVTVNIQFDCRSIAATDAMAVNAPTSQTVTVPKNSTVYDALQKITDFAVTYNENQSMVTAFAEIGDINTLCNNFNTKYNSVFQNAGWMYSGEHVDGYGIQNDKLTQDDTITFRYTVYFGAKSENEWVNFDWDFVDAYYGIQEDITTAKALSDSDYTTAQWAALQDAITNAVTTLSDIQAADKNEYLTYGLILNYIAEKGTSLWGPDSPTEQLQTAQKNLKRAIDKVVAPTGVAVPSGIIEIPMDTTYQLKATVLPAEASQSVTFEKFPYLNADCYELSDTGLITPIKATSNGKCMVTVTSVEDPTKSANFFFKITEAPAKPAVDMNKLLDNIAASYADSAAHWTVMEMGAYAKAFPDKAKLSDTAKQNYINLAVNQLLTKKGDYGDLDAAGYDKIILALTAIGIDPAQLYPVNSNTPVSAIAGLNSVTQSTSAWSAPFTLAAYQQKKDVSTKNYENALIDALLKAQKDDGSWDEFGTIDTTANVIAGLSFYAEREDVSAAIENGIGYLSSKQKDNGAFDDGQTGQYAAGINANSTAMVIVGLCAAGVNPDTDKRFIKNEKSALDGLLSFAPADHSGFGKQNNTKSDPGATEQGFRALIAASQVMSTGKAYNIYDFSANQVEPGRATGSGTVVTPSEPDTEKTITVNFTLKSDVDYWIPTTNVTVKEGSTVYHAFTSALNTAGITYEGAESGYVSSITKDGRTLAEFTNGKNSGWLYKVNGELPEIGLTSYKIHNGDNIVFYYTNDWTLEPGAWTGKEDVTPEFSDVSAGSYYADAVEWAVKKGITVGTSDTTFSPDDNCTREQMAMFLWKAAGSPEPKQTGANFTDLPGGSTAKAMLWVAEQNITSGTSDTTFSPETTCTRAQMAAFLYRYAGSPAVSGTCAFADVSAEAYYHDAVLWCVHQSITAGTGGDNFSPDAPCTRGQMVTFLYRFLGNHS